MRLRPRNGAHPAHICTGTGLTPPASAPGLGPTPPASAPGLGAPPATSAPETWSPAPIRTRTTQRADSGRASGPCAHCASAGTVASCLSIGAENYAEWREAEKQQFLVGLLGGGGAAGGAAESAEWAAAWSSTAHAPEVANVIDTFKMLRELPREAVRAAHGAACRIMLRHVVPGFRLRELPRDMNRTEWAHPWSHLHRDWAHPGHICTGTDFAAGRRCGRVGLLQMWQG